MSSGILYPDSSDNLGYIDETFIVQLLMYENSKDFKQFPDLIVWRKALHLAFAGDHL